MATHYTIETSLSATELCFGTDAEDALRYLRMALDVGSYVTIHPYRHESAEWNMGRMSQHRCPVCPVEPAPVYQHTGFELGAL